MCTRRRLILILIPCALSLAGVGSADPGVLVEVDRQGFELSVRDLLDGSVGPRLRVAVGSPAHDTPAGDYSLHRVVRNPAWRPGATARSWGAEEIPPSPDGPMGMAKIPFGEGGYAIHGGIDSLLLGKSISLGCVRTEDTALLALLDWLEGRGALGPTVPRPDGERHQAFSRPARLLIR